MFILPYNRENEVRTIPWIVIALIVSNSLILCATYLLSSPDAVFPKYGFTPLHPQLKTGFYSMFLHAGFWHLLGNMWFLWMFGNRVESLFRPWFFGPAYLVCGLGALSLHYAFNVSSSVPCVGASGAISGIVGIYFVLFPRSKFDLVLYYGWVSLKTWKVRTHVAVGAWIAEQIVLGTISQAVHASSIAFWAHVGGFATGMILAVLFKVVVPAQVVRARLRATPWYMDPRINRDDDHLTILKL